MVMMVVVGCSTLQSQVQGQLSGVMEDEGGADIDDLASVAERDGKHQPGEGEGGREGRGTLLNICSWFDLHTIFLQLKELFFKLS